MPNNDFEERFKGKLSDLQPSEIHRDEDWALLGQQLDTALPLQKRRRRVLFLPLFLVGALVLSNGLWGFYFNQLSTEKNELVSQLATVQSAAQSVQNTHFSTKTDTIYQKIYVFPKNTTPQYFEQKSVKTPFLNTNQTAVLTTQNDSWVRQKPDFDTIKISSSTTPSRTPEASASLPTPVVNLTLRSELPSVVTPPQTTTLVASKTKHPTFQMGLRTELISPLSTGLKMEAGYGFGLQAGIKFNKNWQLNGGVGMVFLNYTATDKTAILGAPELPAAANSPNALAQMHMNNQGCMRYDLNLRYGFTPLARLQPFLSVGMTGMKMQAHQMNVQVFDAQNTMIYQTNFTAMPQVHNQHLYRLGAGVYLPLSQRIGMDAEAYFMRQWRKTTALAPDFIGLQVGLNYNF